MLETRSHSHPPDFLTASSARARSKPMSIRVSRSEAMFAILGFGGIGDGEDGGVALNDEIGVKAIERVWGRENGSSSQTGTSSGGSVEDGRVQCSCCSRLQKSRWE